MTDEPRSDEASDLVPADQARRRRRVRHPADTAPSSSSAGGAVTTSAITADADDPQPEPAVVEVAEAEASPAERGLRGLIGGGSSQVKPTVAMRARDAARPRESDLARAEAELAIVRRNWTPRD